MTHFTLAIWIYDIAFENMWIWDYNTLQAESPSIFLEKLEDQWRLAG